MFRPFVCMIAAALTVCAAAPTVNAAADTVRVEVGTGYHWWPNSVYFDHLNEQLPGSGRGADFNSVTVGAGLWLERVTERFDLGLVAGYIKGDNHFFRYRDVPVRHQLSTALYGLQMRYYPTEGREFFVSAGRSFYYLHRNVDGIIGEQHESAGWFGSSLGVGVESRFVHGHRLQLEGTYHFFKLDTFDGEVNPGGLAVTFNVCFRVPTEKPQ